MNERFVCIKVDREERPDVDAACMEACQAMTGQGGWPLNAFLTPDREPFYVGTYFPPAAAPRDAGLAHGARGGVRRRGATAARRSSVRASGWRQSLGATARLQASEEPITDADAGRGGGRAARLL